MPVIALDEVAALEKARVLPLVYSTDGSVQEPWFDYDDEGNPKDFGFDVEPPDATAEDKAALINAATILFFIVRNLCGHLHIELQVSVLTFAWK